SASTSSQDPSASVAPSSSSAVSPPFLNSIHLSTATIQSAQTIFAQVAELESAVVKGNKKKKQKNKEALAEYQQQMKKNDTHIIAQLKQWTQSNCNSNSNGGNL